jgi:ferrochelatase
MLASYISKKREPEAQEIYKQIGGKSPILKETLEQKKALEKALGKGYEVFIAMRHWEPMTEIAVREVKAYKPDRVVLLPLYPQFSRTTSGSSFKEWFANARKYRLKAKTAAVCCYPDNKGFVDAYAELIERKLKKISTKKTGYRVLFSAHGLPLRNIKKGDPYQKQVEKTASSIVKKLKKKYDLDWSVCYQSKVGNMEWLKPSTEDEIARAAKDNKQIVLVPIAFVSEHSETLVELDIEYKELAKSLGVKGYHRIPTVSTNKHFIRALADLCRQGAVNRCGVIGSKVCNSPCGELVVNKR